ncbi:hypothetical protein ACSIGC_01460 [Tenacibaculum sp. ZS6-P6]|uniref:hypothetical protein n=1 Tax=Tenacibaculum sp. ZS6-P6 TaxID=3447503 RepID=UPI003F9A0066
MKTLKKYLSVVMLLLLLLSPSIIQLVHSFDSDHIESEICISENDQHLHEHEVECEICKFNFNSFTTIDFTNTTFISYEKIDFLTSLYTSLESYLKLSFSLRAPPSLV